ncbi:site-specific integrase [Streptococcus dysgalactiae]|uniref:Phage integrase site specific recombinase n=1 Tax=Streptococcus dysgalactiae subsp. equisimilis TaxID=119602 RepID=A0AAE9R0B5_STREQ|nr:site-specific integrase [Streptococcus dysgalactiae]OBY99831.1 integrase [Streptococcus dysgalactiae subsp. equisimilis]OCX04129.1 integrase [Streptococcus dysgalactiae subsp. equisimilis]VTT17853.1 phage integrase site specific recombinase [Streptococcus dysgalactiae]VTT27309.1 phage integrase site specific recombinase [Streptococcus dysgalactiae subsp. equisimilis]
MANARYRRRGNQNLWAYEIREEGKTVAYNSGFKIKKLAEAEAEPILQKLRTGSIITKNISLPELYQEWLDLKIMPSNRSDVTKKKYLSRKVTLEKLFGDKPISQIRPSEYQRIMNNYGQRVSRNFLGRLNTGVKQSLQMAIADKVMIEDFTQNVELFSTVKSQDADSKYLHSEKAYLDLINAVKDKFNYKKSVVPYIIYFLLKTGMRYGELIALTWEDIDFDKGIFKTYRRFNSETSQFVPPKNKTSIRIVPVDNECLEILKNLKIEQNQSNKELGLQNTNNMVFQHIGYPNSVPSTNGTNKVLRGIVQELNIEPIITTKGARHTYGSFLWHRGYDLGIIAKILGHKDISMLIEVYGHTLEEKIQEEYNEIKQLW